MKCKHFKIRSKKGKKYYYCTLLKKEISFSCYRECDSKEYKCTKSLNNCAKKIHKSSKIAKLERNRKSAFTDNLDKCIMCNNPRQHLHEIYMGRNRQNSMKYGMVIPLCYKCHQICHKDSHIQEFWHRKGQLYYESELGNREQFIDIFKKNYL